MSMTSGGKRFFIGWDVGGWNCDHNAKSRDAIVILNEKGDLLGRAWRGSLRLSINEAHNAREWMAALFGYCGTNFPDDCEDVVMGIDTPLGFSDEFRSLLGRGLSVDSLGESQTNPYLYRATERFLFARGIDPLSPIKDMIGSQATKGMHVLARFAPIIASCGVWTDGLGFRAIEAYPSASKRSAPFMKRLEGRPDLGDDDKNDAFICAMIARLFCREPASLEAPGPEISTSEGWIWFPKP